MQLIIIIKQCGLMTRFHNYLVIHVQYQMSHVTMPHYIYHILNLLCHKKTFMNMFLRIYLLMHIFLNVTVVELVLFYHWGENI